MTGTHSCFIRGCEQSVAGVFYGHNTGRPIRACDEHLRSAEKYGTHTTRRGRDVRQKREEFR